MLTSEQAARGWIVRQAEDNSAMILVRGARVGDHPFDYLLGFVYAETSDEAESYDRVWGYAQ